MSAKRLAGEVSKAMMNLDASSSSSLKDGFFKNSHGFYWNSAIFKNLLNLRQQLTQASKDSNERYASMYATAALLWNALHLEDAARMCQELMRLRPERCYPEMNLLVLIEARRGDLIKANDIAKTLRENPAASSFYVCEEDIRKEYEIGRAEGYAKMRL